MRLALHPEARAEYGAAVQFYDQLRAGLGIRFIFCVEAALQAALESPFASQVLDPGVRRRLTRTFPYAVLYSVDPDTVWVLAIMHCQQKPGYWRARVGQPE